MHDPSCGRVCDMTETAPQPQTEFSRLLKDWRMRRHVSQLSLGLGVDVSARHISFLESGRSRPSRTMIERLCDGLDIPLGDRNALFSAAGFANAYRRSRLDDDTLAPARAALSRIMNKHAPFPALMFDRHWNALDANATGALLLGFEPGTSETPNMIDALLGADGLRDRILNWDEVAQAMVVRLRAESRHAGGDHVLDEMADQIETSFSRHALPDMPATPFMALKFDLGTGTPLSLFTTVAEISSPYDVTLTDVRLELFFPADAASRLVLEAMAPQSPS
jgi:transcriptional regulator with XRE-family HTH domain